METERTGLPGLISLPSARGFPLNYRPTRIDRVALDALLTQFPASKISEVRTKYKRARISVDAVKQDLLEYSVPKVARPKDPIYYSTVASVAHRLAPEERLIPVSFQSVIESEGFPGSKSPGINLKPDYATKRDAVSDPVVVRSISRDWRLIGLGRRVPLPDCAAYCRAQICTRDKNKVRATWGYPLEVYLEEARFFTPILKHFKSAQQPIIAYGLEMVNGGMHYINRGTKTSLGFNFMTDWSKFDKTPPPWLIRDAFGILENWIDFSHMVNASGEVVYTNPDMARARWKVMVNYFINTPVRLSNGERYLKVGGVPSGSCFTNVIDCIINVIMTRYLSYHTVGAYPMFECYLGDDAVTVLHRAPSVVEFARLGLEVFGAVLNVEKSLLTRSLPNVYFLGYFNDNGQALKSLDTIIASAVYPERPTMSPLETIARLVGQAYALFNPTHAAKFIKAAEIVRRQDAMLEASQVNEYLAHYMQRGGLRYLRTIGWALDRVVLPKGVDLQTEEWWGTQPKTPRRKYKSYLWPTAQEYYEFWLNNYDSEDDWETDDEE